MEKQEIGIIHSKKSMTSYGFGKFVNEFFNMAFGAFVFYFYEAELGLSSWLTSIGFIIFAIWNAVNDPIIGYLMDRPFKFTKKWGRRFPWVFIGGVPWILSYVLIFTPPSVDPVNDAWILFLWIVITTCLYDTFASIFNVSFYSIFPDKFRSETERRLAAGISTLVGTFGVALGAIVPPLFIKFGDLQTYVLQAGVVMIVCFIALALAIPGTREDQVRIDDYLEKYKERHVKESFFKEFKICLKHKNFLAFLFAYLFYRSLIHSLIGSLPYVVRYGLGLEASAVTLIMAGFLIGSFCSIPIWTLIANKTNNDRKTIIIAGFLMTLFTAPLIFLNDLFAIVIATLIWGSSLGGFWVMLDPIMSDIIDESVVMTGKRKEGFYNGVQVVFGRMGYVAQALSFAIVHFFTGFKEGASIQSSEAIFGIFLHFGLIPTIFILIGSLILLKFYKLTPDKTKANKEKMKEMNL